MAHLSPALRAPLVLADVLQGWRARHLVLGAVFAVGVPWIAVVAEPSTAEALGLGPCPFVAGGLVQAALAPPLVPGLRRPVPGADGTGD